jgi:hypothetical protein
MNNGFFFFFRSIKRWINNFGLRFENVVKRKKFESLFHCPWQSYGSLFLANSKKMVLGAFFLTLRICWCRCVERSNERLDHHGCLFQCIVPASPAEPHDTLPCSNILWIVKIKSIETSAATLPPPAALSFKI